MSGRGAGGGVDPSCVQAAPARSRHQCVPPPALPCLPALHYLPLGMPHLCAHSPPRRLSDGRTEVVGESGTVTSLGLSRCGRWLTANLSDSCIHLWSLRDLAAAGAHPPSPLGPPADALNGAAAAAAAELQWSPRQHGGGGDPFDSLPAAPVHEFRMADARPSRFVLRSCVGGARAGFVACGAEDCR